MSILKYTFLLAFLAIASTNLQAQKKSKTIVETEFKVSGSCEMCEERIENALSVKGIKYASWDVDTRVCKVVYNSSKIQKADMSRLLNEVGHDTELERAPDEKYCNLHSCCKYRVDDCCEGDE